MAYRRKTHVELMSMSRDELVAELWRARAYHIWLHAVGFWWRLNIYLLTGRWR